MKIYDMHCDVLCKLRKDEKEGRGVSLRQNEHHIDLLRMKQAGYGLQCFAAFVNQGEDKDVAQSALEQIDIFHRQMEENQDLIAPIYCYEDIRRNDKQEKMSALLTIEGGEACGGSLAMLRNYYRMGVRLMTLTWNYENELGFPNINMGDESCSNPFFADTKNGLKENGIVFLEEMECLGMAVDVSHLSDAGFYDVAAHTKKPFLATHSNAREEASFVRNLTDDMIRVIAERGGVIGINYCADFLWNFAPGEKTVSRVEDMVRHIRHMVNVGGVEIVGLGSDFDGIGGELEISDCGKIYLLADALKNAGFPSSVQDKILGGNVDRVLRDLL